MTSKTVATVQDRTKNHAASLYPMEKTSVLRKTPTEAKNQSLPTVLDKDQAHSCPRDSTTRTLVPGSGFIRTRNKRSTRPLENTAC